MAAGEPSYKSTEDPHPNGATKRQQYVSWRTRRRITICAGVWLVVKTLLLFFYVPTEKISALTGPIETSYYVLGMVIAAYIGFKAFGKDQASKT